MMDGLRTIVTAGSLALVGLLCCAFFVTLRNSESRNLALAFSALFGATLAFVVQTYFELRRTTEVWTASTELTIDRQRKTIRQWRYPFEAVDRMFNDIRATEWLLSVNPHALDADSAMLCRDLTLHDTLSLFAYHSASWNMQTAAYKGSIGTMLMFAPREGPATLVSTEDFPKQLESAG